MKNCKAYHLLHDAYYDETYTEAIIVPKNGTRYSHFDERLISFGRGSLKTLWPSDLTVSVTGKKPVDYLFCSAYIDAVSERVRNVIQKIAPLDVEFFPLDVFFEDGRPFSTMKYWAIYVLPIVDALDWANTIWSTENTPARNDPTAFLSIIKPRLIESRIIDKNIFRIEVASKITSGTYISHLVKTSLIKAGCTIGMDFGQIKTI